MPLKFEGAAHAAFAQFASERPGQIFPAPEIKKAVVATGFPGAVSGLIPGDHAVKLDGSPANESHCNCANDPETALFTQTGGRRHKALYMIRANRAASIRDADQEKQEASPVVFPRAVSQVTDLNAPEPQPAYNASDTLHTAIKRMTALILQRCDLSGTILARSQPTRETELRPELEAMLLAQWTQQKGVCGLCEKPIPMPPVVGPLQPSVDRVDSDDPSYLTENVHITHLGCNLAKNRFSISEYRRWLLVIRD